MKKIASVLIGLGMMAGTVVVATPASADEWPIERVCDENYSGACVPVSTIDLQCWDIAYRQVNVIGKDVHNFDGDGNGLGCEVWEGTYMEDWLLLDYPRHPLHNVDGWKCNRFGGSTHTYTRATTSSGLLSTTRMGACFKNVINKKGKMNTKSFNYDVLPVATNIGVPQ
jgi:hypothetical protein